MTANESCYELRVLRVGSMPEVPSCAIRQLRDIGQWEPSCYTMLIARSPERTVIINAGFPDDIAPLVTYWQAFNERCVLHRAECERVERLLAAAQVRLDAVSHLLIAPIGPYSTGKMELFAKAQICIGRTAWTDFCAPPAHVPPDNPRHLAFPPPVLRRLILEDWPRVRLLDDEDEVCPGIRVFRVGAHHRGSLAVAIRTAKGVAIYTDAFPTLANFAQRIPSGFCRNVDEFHAAVARIGREASVVLPAFDPELFTRHPGGLV